MQRLIETISLFVLIAVAILRPLVAESYDSAGSPLTAALGAVRDPSPVRTLVFDLLILGGVSGWLLARAIGSARRYRWTGLEWGTGLVAVAVVVSCVVAGNKRLAINASIDWLCLPLLTIGLVQLMHRPAQRRLLLTAVLASACVQAFQCAEQHFVGFDETQAHYEAIRNRLWVGQGVEPDSAKVEMFERRMRAREATGSLPHSNVTGSYLVLCGIAAIALPVAMWKRREDRTGGRDPQVRWDARAVIKTAGSVVGAVFILGAATLTKSVGAMIAGVVGILLWGTLAFFKRWIDSHRGKVFVAGWLVVAAGLLGVIGYGLYRDSLPGWSLTFRWQYWKASAGLIADYGLTGVGRENFGRHYLQYKPIESPEEVTNPHNLFVQAAADWGVLGLAGIVTMLVGASKVLVLRRAAGFSPRGAPPLGDAPRNGTSAQAEACGLPRPDTARVKALGDAPRNGTSAQAEACGSDGFGDATRTLPVWAVALAAVVIVVRLPLMGTDDPSFLYYTSVTTGLCWLPGFALFWYGSSDTARHTDQGGCRAGTGVAVGVFAFVLHDMINFAAFVPGSATTMFALLAFAVGERPGRWSFHLPGERGMRVRTHARAGSGRVTRRWLPPVAAAAGVVAVLCTGLTPVARSEHYLNRARGAARELLPVPVTAQVADDHFRRAAQADPLDPTPCAERARWLIALSTIPELRGDALQAAEESLSEAVRRDPFSIRLRRMQMRLFKLKAGITQEPEDYRAAVDAARRALELYPGDPKGLAALADRLLEAGRAVNSADLLERAIANYRRALRLDEERLYWEELHRLRAKERQAIEDGIDRASRLLQQQP